MLPPETHLLAAALLTYADDEGYFNANPVLLKAGTVPLRTDKHSVEVQLRQLEELGYIEVRRSGVRSFGRITTFTLHQRVSHPTASKLRDKFESLPKDSRETPDTFRPEVEQGMEQGTGNREASTANAVPASPAAFALPLLNGRHVIREDDVVAWQKAYPAVDIMAELHRVDAWLRANPQKQSKTATGSMQRLVRWFTKEQDKGGRSNGTGNYQGKTRSSLNAAHEAIAILQQREAAANRANVGEAWGETTGEAGAGRLLGPG